MQHGPVGGTSTTVPLADIASNPANPAVRESDDLSDLADSIAEIGIVQALTVVPAADWLQRHPEHAEAVGEKSYVLLAGHRRRAAGLLAGQTHAPVMVRPELADTGVSDVQLHENLHRLALTPLQEARAYQAKVDEGHSQRAIAAAVKVSQGQVAKRLSLLQLPESVQTAVDQGWYTVIDALELLKLEADVIEEVAQRVTDLIDPQNMLAQEAAEADADLNHTEALAARAMDAFRTHELRLSSITADAQRAVSARRRQAEAQAKAEELGAQYVTDPREKFRGRQYDHQLHNRKDIERHAKKGNLAIAPGYGDEPNYYALAKENPKQRSVSDQERERQEAEQRKKKARTEGRKARIAAIAQLVGKRPTAGELREHLVLHILEAPMYDSESKKLARKIAMEAGVGPAGTEGYYDWMTAAQTEHDPTKRDQLAWILVWAAREQQHHYTTSYSQWGESDVGYLDDLIRLANYEPGEWEQEQLAKVRDVLAQEAETSQAAGGDGSPHEEEGGDR
ncbi:MAG: ParB/RepB/Spo0J family partition protein [Actinobacteria bacterium]|nr:ParB/RepB/Spo0J family partition protein [Actinomycetota bacterium]